MRPAFFSCSRRQAKEEAFLVEGQRRAAGSVSLFPHRFQPYKRFAPTSQLNGNTRNLATNKYNKLLCIHQRHRCQQHLIGVPKRARAVAALSRNVFHHQDGKSAPQWFIRCAQTTQRRLVSPHRHLCRPRNTRPRPALDLHACHYCGTRPPKQFRSRGKSPPP